MFCFIVLISLFPFPASGQIPQLLRNCSTRDSCVPKCCTVGLVPARLQLASYRNCFFLSILLLPLLFTLADLPHCVWKAGHREIWCLHVISFQKMLLHCCWRTSAIRDSRSCFITKHILFPRCPGLDRPVKCTLQCHSRLSSRLTAALDLLLEFSCGSISLCSSNAPSIWQMVFYVLGPPSNYLVSTLKVFLAC